MSDFKNVFDTDNEKGSEKKTESGSDGPNRRSFLKAGMGAMAALAAAAGVLAPLRDYEGGMGLNTFLQTHYKKLTPEKLAEILSRIENEIAKNHGVKATVQAQPPLDGVQFGYALSLSRCTGVRKCVTACMEENNQSRDPEMQYIRVIEMDNGSFDMEKGDHYYDPETVPREGKFYMPVQCQQCANPPCVKACPVEATWQEKDGITVIDYDWCIGCRYCMAACPYEARHFNYSAPSIPKEEINPNMGYLSNRIRPAGVVEKCHFCLHRTREGKNPACMEACPTGARIFGNLLDPESEIRYILKHKRVYILKEDAGTMPRFFYYFDS
jgi:molybdopterin-containing oxidoreductase family iron-sulfur binding subunit